MDYKKLFKISQFYVVVMLILVCSSIWNYNQILNVNDNLLKDIDNIEKNYDESLGRLKEMNSCLQDNLVKEVRHSIEVEAENLQLRDTLKEVRESKFAYSKSEVELLCKTVQAEAGYFEGHEKSQKYVAQVILNRVNSSKYPNSISNVVYQKNEGVPQFSVAYNGVLSKQVIEEETLNNVYDVLLYGTNLPEDVLYFYSTSVKENWVNKLPIYEKVQGTVFAYGKE